MMVFYCDMVTIPGILIYCNDGSHKIASRICNVQYVTTCGFKKKVLHE